MSIRKMEQTEEEAVWTCQYCGIHNTLLVDLTVPGKQDTIEECRICSRPNRVIVYKGDEDLICEARHTDE